MANAHSHAFQRGLRGAAERPSGASTDDFWSWRERMYALSERAEPEWLRKIGDQVYAEMAAAGYGAVGEFHYLHHRPGGRAYEEPNAMAIALAEAALGRGLRVVLLPAAYHRNGWDGGDRPPQGGQRRFCDPTVAAFLDRVDGLRAWARDRPGVEVAVAAHSVRAVPAPWLEAIAAYSERHDMVRHVHAHEQRRELDECDTEHGCSPVELLARTGFLGPRTSIVHGIHVSARDVELLAASDTIVVSCPTTEGNLGDGHLPAMAYSDAGVRLALGSDSQVRVDPFEETRELETGARRERETRHGLLARTGDLWDELCRNGCASLGIEDAGTVAIDRDHHELAGVADADLPYALATCASASVVAGPVGRR